MARNPLKNHVAQELSVALTASTQSQTTVTIPSYGADISSVEFDISVATTGTISGPNALSTAIYNVSLETKDGKKILNNINGNDIAMLTRIRSIGRTVTDPSVADAAATQFDLPLNIERSDQEVKLTVTLNTLAALATSGLTAATITLKVIFWYADATQKAVTEKIQKLHLSIASGDNNLSSQLPSQISVYNLAMRVTDETVYNYFGFTADGNKELDNVTVNQLKGKDNALLVSGHVTNQFVLPVASFYISSATQFTCNTSSTDTMDIFLIGPQ